MTADEGAGQARIVVGVDGSSHSKKALQWAAHLAAVYGARLEAVTAWEYPQSFGWAAVPEDWDPAGDMAKVLAETISEVLGDSPPPGLEQRVGEGGAAKVLLDAARGAIMLVVGSRGHGGFAGLLLGSVSANLAEHSPVPVLIIHGNQQPPPVRV